MRRLCDCVLQDGNTIAVRAGQAMQIFNLELGKKVKSHKMDDAKPVQFWCWISLNTIAVVTDTEVFHWSIDGACGQLQPFGCFADFLAYVVLRRPRTGQDV